MKRKWFLMAGAALVLTLSPDRLAADEMRAAFITAADEGEVLDQLGHTAREKVSADATGGDYYVFDVVSPPGLGIPPHVHAHEDEVVYVVEGTYEVFLGGQIHSVGPGTVLNFARGTPHGFANVGTGSGRTLWFVTPGAGFQSFFRELAEVPPGPPDPAALGELFSRHGIELLPPPR